MPKNFTSIWIPKTWHICPEVINIHSHSLELYIYNFSGFSYKLYCLASCVCLELKKFITWLTLHCIWTICLSMQLLTELGLFPPCVSVTSSAVPFPLCACWDTCLRNSFLVCAQDGTVKPDGNPLIDIVRSWHIAFSKGWSFLMSNVIKWQFLHIRTGILVCLLYFIKSNILF